MDDAMTLNINLTPQLEDMVRRKVADGLYSSASEVVREALRLMAEQDRLREAKLEQLRHALNIGIESGGTGKLDAAAIKQRGREKLDRAAKD